MSTVCYVSSDGIFTEFYTGKLHFIDTLFTDIFTVSTPLGLDKDESFKGLILHRRMDQF